MKIEEVRELVIQKEKTISTELDREKINNLKILLSDDMIFFKLDLKTIVGILDFLGINEELIADYALSLISPDEYTNLVNSSLMQ